MSHHQALVLAHSGQMRNARILWRPSIERAQQTGDPEKVAIYQAAEAVCEAHIGNRDQAKAGARGTGAGERRDVVYSAAFALALAGDASGSQNLTIIWQSVSRNTPPCNSSIFPRCARFVILRQGSVGRDRLPETALPYDLAMPGTAFFAKFGGLYTAYVRGKAYLDAGRGQGGSGRISKSATVQQHFHQANDPRFHGF